MNRESEKVSAHYLGERGKQYREVFAGLEYGRLFQIDQYFGKYCSDDKVLLDVGSADGLFLRRLPAKRRIGIEVNDSAIAACEALCVEEAIAVEVHKNLSFIDDNVIDLAISNHCLEHILNPYEALRHIRRVLKPGGLFVLVVPFDDFRFTPHRRWRAEDKNNHLYTWTPLDIGNLLTEAGFNVDFANIQTLMCPPKIHWIGKVFGKGALRIAGFLVSFLTHRREVFCVATRTS